MCSVYVFHAAIHPPPTAGVFLQGKHKIRGRYKIAPLDFCGDRLLPYRYKRGPAFIAVKAGFGFGVELNHAVLRGVECVVFPAADI